MQKKHLNDLLHNRQASFELKLLEVHYNLVQCSTSSPEAILQ